MMVATGRERVDKLRSAMTDRGLDAVVVFAAPSGLGPTETTAGNVRFFAGWGHSFRSSCLVVLPGAEPVLLLQSPADIALLTAAKKSEEQPAVISEIWVDDVRLASGNRLGSVARDVLTEHGITSGRVGVIGRHDLSVPLHGALTAQPSEWTFEDADDLLNSERVAKADHEIEAHRRAGRISDSMIAAAMDVARVSGSRAWQVLAEMKSTAWKLDATFVTAWVSSGPSPNAWAHDSFLTTQELTEGDQVHVGTYVAHRGYYGHGIRMAFKGTPPPGLRRCFDGVVQVQAAGISELRPGNKLANVVAAMERAIDEQTPIQRADDPLRFRLGHGLGLSYNDPLVSDVFSVPADRRQESEIVVQPGMVLELHPNYLVPQFGRMRLGDMMLVTDDGAERLTNAPRELFEI